ncbi:MAG TPA: lysophospholipid acyltransferase family protein [Steroidobacteraceae bacterium]|nr:lysophospholipid acyltransferase family protein [Steroidobacteraceae bacterium]
MTSTKPAAARPPAEKPPRKALQAPHRRKDRGLGPRPLEKAAIVAYRGGMWLMGRLPVPVARAIVSFFLQLSFFLVPRKRKYVNDNFAHVLGRSPTSLEVRRKAYAAYRSYARYVVELMRLPRLSDAEAADLVDTSTLLPLEAYWKSTGKGLILTTAHIGNLEGVGRGIARHGWPIAAIADDTSFPELFDLLRKQRKAWGVELIPWRNLRDLFGVLRRNEILALIIDWGYRPDDVPVRLFGAWTTLPAGPATLAAKTGASIVHIAIRRSEDRKGFLVTYSDPIMVASTEPAEIRRATQAIADALAATIAAAPEQWYSFKPIWPMTAEEKAELAARATAANGGAETSQGGSVEGTGALAPAG